MTPLLLIPDHTHKLYVLTTREDFSSCYFRSKCIKFIEFLSISCALLSPSSCYEAFDIMIGASNHRLREVTIRYEEVAIQRDQWLWLEPWKWVFVIC